MNDGLPDMFGNRKCLGDNRWIQSDVGSYQKLVYVQVMV